MSTRESVLVLTNQRDATADLVVEHLNTRGVPVFAVTLPIFLQNLT
jgi:hypothetical protein